MMKIEPLTPEEIVEEVDYIARIVPDTLEEARAMIEDIADLTSSYFDAEEAGKEVNDE
jgi:hypothetical protein